MAHGRGARSRQPARASAAVVLAAALGVLPWVLGAGAPAPLAWVVPAWAGLALVAAWAAARLASRPQRSASLAQARARLRGRLDVLRVRAHDRRRLAERAQRSKEEFLAAVSHELRTPLNSIQGFAEVLLAEIEGPLTDSQREDVEAIHAAGAYLKELVDEVLDSSSRRTPAAARLERVDLGALVRDVARHLEVQRRDKPLAIVAEVDPELPLFAGDRRRLRQILLNLGGNAVKFTREGHVRFHARPAPGGAIRITVEDTGPGIPKGDLERIFRAFERVDTNRGRTEGWGLGLAIAREMAQWHAGRIEVESEIGRGSRFTLVLPPSRAPEERGS